MVLVRCVIVNCNNTKKNSDCKFYQFPRPWWKRDQRNKWIIAVRRKNPDGSLWQPKPDDRICSAHFIGGRKADEQASPSYIPKLFPPAYKSKRIDENSEMSRFQRYMKRRSTRAVEAEVVHPNNSNELELLEYSVNLKVDTECQVDLYYSKNIQNPGQTFICNRYIFYGKETCDAEVQTEIDINTISINAFKMMRHQGCNTAKSISIDQATTTVNKYFAGFQSINTDEQLVDLAVLPIDQSAEETEVSHHELERNYSQEMEASASEESKESPEPIGASSIERSGLEPHGGHQTFFPSFASLFEPRQQSLRLSNFANQEAAYSQRPNSYRNLLNNYALFNNYRNFDSFSKQNAPAPIVDSSSTILGSGNFGVIKGGTFSEQGDGESDYDGFSFYNNGHGRPSLGVGYVANPRPDFNEEQFANFRDFADINTPSNGAFSEFVVVYANKNGTIENHESHKAEPKNIIETLQMLDEQQKSEPKLTKAKLKLLKTLLPEKKNFWMKKSTPTRSLSELEDPLVALS